MFPCKSLQRPLSRSKTRSKLDGVCVSGKQTVSVSHLKFRPHLYGETLSRVEGSLVYPSYPGQANFSYISLQNLANRLHEKQIVGSAGKMTRLAGLPFFDGRVTLLAGATFLHINTLARVAGSTPSKRAKGSTFFSYKRSLKLTRLGG